jgi:hypothetical protein
VQQGDVNGDGVFNAGDVTQLELCILYPGTYPIENYPCWDANEDGFGPNAGDILAIEYRILEIWPPNHVHIEAPDELANCTNFTARVHVNVLVDFDSASYNITYNASVLDVNDVTDGNVNFTDIPVTNYSFPQSGVLWIQNDVPGNPGVNDSGYLSAIQFHVNGSACDTTSIAFNESASWLKDNTGTDMNVTWANDSFHVAP